VQAMVGSVEFVVGSSLGSFGNGIIVVGFVVSLALGLFMDGVIGARAR
jgi:hypothetical protein